MKRTRFTSIRLTRQSLRYAEYLFWLGPLLILAGAVVGSLQSWNPLSIGLAIAGVVLIGLWVLFLGQFHQGFWQRRSTQTNTNTLVTILAVLVILGLLNFLVVRNPIQLDLTENRLFTLAPESQQLIKALDQPVKVWIFDVNQNEQDRQLLDNYRRQNNQFSYEYIDPYSQPQLAQQFGVQAVGEVHLEAGGDRQFIQTLNQIERLSESTLTNRLGQLGRDATATVYFLQGHGEKDLNAVQGGLSQAKFSLENKGYRTDVLNLAEIPSVPADAAVVVVAGPEQEFFEAELNTLETYLNQGGSALVLVDPNVDPGLDDFLATWGITLVDQLVVDVSGAGQLLGLGPAAPLVTDYGDHPITRELADGRSVYPLTRPIDITEKPGIEAIPLLFTNEQTRAEEIPEDGDIELGADNAPQGPLIIGVALSQTVDDLTQNNPSPANPTAEGEASEEDLSKETGADDSEPASGAEAKESAEPESSTETAPPAESTDNEEPEPTESSRDTAESEASEEAPEASAEETEEADAAPEARLVVIGNSSFAADGLFELQLNGDVFLNAVSWLSQSDEENLSIRPRAATNRRIIMTLQQQIILGLTALLLLPLLGFGAAVFTWLKHR